MPAAEREYQQVVREIEGSPLPDMNWSTQSSPPPAQRVRQTRYNQARPAPVPVIRKGLQALERAVPQVREAEAFVGGGIKIIGSRLAQSSMKAATAQRGQIASTTKKAISDVWDGASGQIKQNYGSNKAIKSSIKDTQRQLDKLKNETWDTVDQSLYGAKADFVTSQATRVTRLTKTLELQKGLLTGARSPPPPQAWNPIVTTGTSTVKQADEFIPSGYKPNIKMQESASVKTDTISMLMGAGGRPMVPKKATGKISATSVETKKRNYLQRRFDGRIPFVNRPWSAMTRGDKVKFGGYGGITMFFGGATIGSSIRPDPFTPELTKQTPYTRYTDPMTLTPPPKGTITPTMTPIQAQLPMQSSMTQAPQKTYPKGIFWSEEHGSYVKKIGTYKKDDPLAGVKKGDPKFSFIKGVGKKTEYQLAQTGKIRIRDPLTGKTKSYTKAEIRELNLQQRQRQAEMLLNPEFAYREAMGQRDRIQGQQIRGMGAPQDWQQSLPKGMDPARVYEFYGGKGNPLA